MQKLKNKMLILGLSPKKEIAKLILIDSVLLILSVLAYFLSKEFTYSIMILVTVCLLSVLYFARYGTKIDQQKALDLQEFTNLFSYFKIYIHNGFSVYSALKEIEQFANESLKKQLKTLIEEIDLDKSIEPFIRFAKNFDEVIVEEMMLTIYQMIDDGVNSDHLLQFEMIYDKFSDLMYQKNLKRKDSKLGTLSSSSLIATCYLMIVLTVGIISVIGELINGI